MIKIFLNKMWPFNLNQRYVNRGKLHERVADRYLLLKLGWSGRTFNSNQLIDHADPKFLFCDDGRHSFDVLWISNLAIRSSVRPDA